MQQNQPYKFDRSLIRGPRYLRHSLLFFSSVFKAHDQSKREEKIWIYVTLETFDNKTDNNRYTDLLFYLDNV